ncbi:M15 family metallopeptidase [Promicromonospora iranensis]|uniref:D-alanyl-D-alanine carboxypeptidase-like core domain-containing protein n=1 Tax=Promicromonospora iranensis TaxID=1105144 RepID=A0ABU2CKS7_9MICO|nr:D-alanyl-D-alanine carboxypeptidase family protein [Promicromonospora iranensis]MDR7381913.1 hypothetical protein [Promicromonospora iranensis]
MLTETPLWPELPTPQQSPSSPRARRAAERRTRRGRRRWWVAAAVVLGLGSASGGAYALGLLDPLTGAAATSAAAMDAQAAVAESATLRAQLAGEVESARAVREGPDGRAAKKPERLALDEAVDDARRLVTSLGSVTWSPSGTDVEARALLERVATLRADTGAAVTTLREATRTAVESGRAVRLERALPRLAGAQADLREAAAAGELVYADSAETAAATDRESLRAVLDQAGDLDAQADALLTTADTAQAAAPTRSGPVARGNEVAGLLGRTGKLATAMSAVQARVEEAVAVVLATVPEEALEVEADVAGPAAGAADRDPADGTDAADAGADGGADTAPAGTCPQPDQVWTAENGHLAPSELAAVPFSPSHQVRADVVGGLAELNEAYVAEFGVSMTINSSYRTYAQQESLYDPSSRTAAPPGCSNHGTGLAIDIGGGVQTFGTAQYEWLKANAEAYGWVHPPFAEPSGRNPEPWHWQSVHAPNSY